MTYLRVSASPEIVVRVGVVSDCNALAPNLRSSDVLECAAIHPGSPRDALRHAAASSKRVFAVTVDGGVVAMFGIVDHPADPTVGIPWFLASSELFQHRRLFLRWGRKLLHSVLLEGYRSATNYTAADNPVAHRWLRRLGFEVDTENVTVGLNGLSMLQFTLTRYL